VSAQESYSHDELRARAGGWRPFETSDCAGPDDLRRVFRRHAAGISVVTTSHLRRPVGLLVNSLASVSATPPLVSFNVALTSSSWPALEQNDDIGVHVLAAEQADLATLFARSGADRFGAPTVWAPGPNDVPVLDGCVSWSLARVQQRVYAGDHVILVARLLKVETHEERKPLLHYDGAYHHATPVPPAHRLSVVGDDPRPTP
jgi:flavin reductase (DIM6/NTAB) family NADH-FMN oxidoreductase RutF